MRLLRESELQSCAESHESLDLFCPVRGFPHALRVFDSVDAAAQGEF